MLKDKLNADLKSAMLSRDKERVETLRGIKSAILYAEVDAGKREEGLSEDETLAVLKKESKKRQDSINLYTQGEQTERADKESSEKQLIDSYLPRQFGVEELDQRINEALAKLELKEITQRDIGKVIGYIKEKFGAQIDGSILIKLIKERMG